MTTLYLHGFCSSPKSDKGILLERAHHESGIRFIAPAMHCGPKKASEIILESIKDVDPADLVIIGSSLGGFYATWLAEKLSARAILLNPAVMPWRVVGDNLGKHRVHVEDIEIEVLPEHLDELREMEVTELERPCNYVTILGTNDEVLDWTEGRDFYRDTEQWIIEGADHRLSDFSSILPRIMEICRKFPD